MSKENKDNPYASKSSPKPLYRTKYRSNTFNRYSPKARLARLIVVLAVVFGAFIAALAVFVLPALNFGKKTEEQVVEVLPTPNPTPNPYGSLRLPADIEFIEDMPSWVKTDVYGEPVELLSLAAQNGDVMMELVDRENVVVKGKSGDYYLVDYNRTFGYIQQKLVYQGPIPALPDVINAVLVTDLISGVKKESQLVNLQEFVPGLVVDMELAKTDNYLGTKMYPVQIALLQYKTALKLKKAQAVFNKDGYTMVLWDAYRPYSVTVEMEELFGDQSKLIATSAKGSRNNRGASVDITIVKMDGTPMEMPSEGMTLDEYLAARVFSNMTEEAKDNVKYMSNVMRSAGFRVSDVEWWHFDDLDWQFYPAMDYDLFDF